MKLFAGLIAIMLFFTLGGTSSRADTDYRCLKDCVRDGKTSTVCMPQCSYNVKPPSGTDTHEAGTSHNALSAPTPLGDNTILPPQAPGSKAPIKDYKCIAQCRHNGMQYGLCEQQCIKPETTTDIPKKHK